MYRYSEPKSEERKVYISRNGSWIPECKPALRYWSSNLLGAYIDTRLDSSYSLYMQGSELILMSCDHNRNEVSYTISSAKENEIKPNQ